MALSDHALSLLIPTLILTHLLVAPYSKVEESFSLQAAHDILRYGIQAGDFLRAYYDHFEFPGAVPRSFVGALILAGMSKPFVALFGGVVNEQVIVRGVLGLLNSLALTYYGRVARKAFGRGIGNWYLILQSSQFHILFYASRTLPNMFAFAFTTIALAQFLSYPAQTTQSSYRRQRLGIYILTFTGIIFRSEIALLLGTHVALYLFQRRTSLTKVVIPAGLTGAFIGLAITLTIDSYFWQTYSHTPPPFSTPILTQQLGLIWPELSAFYFNAIQGSASEWGVNPWHYYFTNSIPKLLMNPFALLFLLPIALAHPASRHPAALILTPVLSFVTGYSSLPHKEWRFIVYIVPHLNLVAAMGAHWIWIRRAKSIAYSILTLALVGSVAATFAASLLMLGISAQNYPGGEALSRLHRHLPSHMDAKSKVTIHLDVPVCMTGATRFLQDHPLYPASPARTEEEISSALRSPALRFDKTESHTLLSQPSFWDRMDWLLSSVPPAQVPSTGNSTEAWEVVDVVRGLGQVRLYRPGEETQAVEVGDGQLGKLWKVVEGVGRKVTRGWWVGIEMEEKVWVLKRRRQWARGVGKVEAEVDSR
ncbi:Alg9-like mannosyltransferase family-domain-containing protein [Kalaharituber pfeilii]|nr:Alg9-like mannosyltransferase family-domain-containing protein [Kalaharituber pfeilii]